MAYLKKITLFILFITFSFTAFSQIEETIVVCNMETIDGDGDTFPDGIINLFQLYEDNFPTQPPLPAGTWSIESSLSFPLDGSTGDVALWEYKFSSSDPIDAQQEEPEYIFELSTGGATPAAIITIELGPYSGTALPPSGANDINFEGCEGLNNLFETLVSNETIPPPHINGIWELVLPLPANAVNFIFTSPTEGLFETEIANDGPGGSTLDRGIFEFRYRVPASDNCPEEITNVMVSVVRQVDAGIPTDISICESEILAGNFEDEIDLAISNLMGEDEGEGIWTASNNAITQISDGFDSVINIEDMYDELITAGPRFGSETYSFTYSVEQRSGVCSDAAATIRVNIYEELRPFNQNMDNNVFCLNEFDQTSTIDLLDFLEFTNEGGTDFIYPNGNWSIVSHPEPQDEFSINDTDSLLLDSILSIFQDTITEDVDAYILPGTYVFRYTVNGPGSCPNLSTDVTIEILPFDYAGEANTTPIEICETQESVVLTNLLEIDPLRAPTVATTGVWTNDADGSILANNFVFPDINADTIFNLTYTTTHASGCVDISTLTFTLINESSPGSAGNPITTDGIITICSNVTEVVLIDQLENVSGLAGIWTGPNAYVSTDENGIIPIADFVAGTYTYTVGDGLNCTTIDTSEITTVLVDPVDFSIPIVSEPFCKIVGSVDLATLLDPSVPTNGVYIEDPTNAINGALTGSVVDFTTLDSGVYNFGYTIDNQPCNGVITQDFVIEVIDTVNAPSAGDTPADPIPICANDRTVNLFDLLEGNPSSAGFWTGPFNYASADHLGTFIENDQSLPILGEGVYTYTVDGGVCNGLSDDATVTIEFVSPIALGSDIFESFCKVDGSVNLFSLLDNNTSAVGVFTALDADPTVLDADGNVSFETLSGTHNFEYSVPNVAPCDISTLNIEITIVEVEMPALVNAEFCILNAPVLDDITLDDRGLQINYYETLLSQNPITDGSRRIIDGEIYYATLEDALGCESERLAVEVSVLNAGSSADCDLEFQDGVSANSDDINDTFSLNFSNEEDFDIPRAFPDYRLEIYNRYGVVVYEGNAQTAEFNGTNNVNLSLGDDLPSGTYYYIFNPNSANNLPIQGSFYLSK